MGAWRLHNWRMLLGGGLGLVVLVWLLSSQDLRALEQALRQAGWPLLLILLVEPLLWLSQTLGWYLLFTPGQRPRFADTYAASAVASAFNNLLPVLAVGGNILKARHLVKRGISGAEATAAGIADISMHGVSALGWSLIGLLMLNRISEDAELSLGSAIGVLLLALAIAAMIGAQLFGSQALAVRLQARFSRRGWDALARNTDLAQRDLLLIWRRRGLLLVSVLARMSGRFVMVPEIIFVSWLLDAPIALGQATLITGLVVLVKTVSFVVPARIGVQEGAFVAAGALIGLPAELMLVVAIAIRLRETVAHLPVFMLWYAGEWREALR